MNAGGDFFASMGWGLRKYAWLVALFVIGLGVLVPVLIDRGADVYEAEAQVGPTQALLLPNLDPLPRLGETVFNNGAVEAAVRQELGVKNSVDVVPSRVELVAPQDNIVFTIIGRDSNPKTAQELANLAAASFTIELNKYTKSVGQFEPQRAADQPAKPEAKMGGSVAIALGLIAGLIAGLGMVALLLVWRRPVLDAESAEEATNAPVIGRLRLPSGRRGDLAPQEVPGMAPLCRRILSDANGTVLMVSPPEGTSQLRQVGSAMSLLLSRVGRPVNEGGQAGSANGVPDGAGRTHLVVSDGGSAEEVASLPDSALTLLLVPEGIGMRALRDAAGEYFTGGPGGLVMVSADNRGRFWRTGGQSQRVQDRRPVTADDAT